MQPLVSIIIVTHNSGRDIVECLESVLQQDYKDIEILVVDNASTDDTIQLVEEHFSDNPIVRVIKNPKNDGYAGGNNLGFHHSNGERIAILNPDLAVEKNWLSALVEGYERHADAGIACSKVILYDNQNIINACGNDIHVTGFVFSRFYMKEKGQCKEEVVAAPSGASMLFSKKKLLSIDRVKPFEDKRFIMEYSDIDLAVDLASHSLSCYVIPDSIVYHKFKFKMDPSRLKTLEVGRYQLLGHFTKRTLFLMLPSLLLAEMIVWVFALTRGRSFLKSKFEVLAWHLANLNRTFRSDNSRTKDKKILSKMTPDLSLYHQVGVGPAARTTATALNRAFRLTKSMIGSD